MRIKVLNRPAKVEDSWALEQEFRAARWVYQRLLDFEFQHQAKMSEAFPKLARVGQLLARLHRRDRWRKRATKGSWTPPEKPQLRVSLTELRAKLKAERDADPRWEQIKKWPLDKAAEKQVRRKKDEPDEKFEARAASAYRTRREANEIQIYSERRCYWGSFNAARASRDLALKSVIKRRAQGLPADLRRPRWSDPGRIVAKAGGFEILDRGTPDLPEQKPSPWWTLRIRLFEGWATFRAKLGNCHALPDDAVIKEACLCRVRDGNRWQYSVSVTVDATWPTQRQLGNGIVGIDTGHRVMGDELRAFVWYGSDGHSGEVRLPTQCAKNLETARKILSDMDLAFDKLGVKDRNRHSYRKRLLRQGVRTAAESEWLAWEVERERRCSSLRRTARNLREETYTRAIQDLRTRYSRMGVDVVGKGVQQKQTEAMARHSTRQHRDLVAAYSIKQLCERFGIEDLAVTARNSTAECPQCGHIRKTKEDLWLRCDSCGLTADQDHGAAYVLMCRAVGTARKLDSKHAESAAE